MRILASAYCCSPLEGSEHYAGHNFVDQIARHHHATVLVPAQLRSALEPWPHPPNVEFEYLPTPLYVPWERVATGSYLAPAASYYLFSLLAYLRAKRLIRRDHFDVTHHITISNYRFPSLLPFLGLPCLLGPLGGGESVPAGLEVDSAYARVRRLSLGLATKDPILHKSLARSRRILVANQDTATRIGPRYQRKTERMPYGFHAEEVKPRDAGLPSGGTVTVLCVSRLVRHKGIELLIRAVPAVAATLDGRLKVLIYGSGDDAPRLLRLAQATGAHRYIEMRHSVKRLELLKRYAEADIFCFPSLRDTCPVALLEAMAVGLPVIVLDHSGPGEIVTDECGMRVPATDLRHTVDALAAAMCGLAKDEELRIELGSAGRKRILQHFRWDDRGDRLAALYAEVL